MKKLLIASTIAITLTSLSVQSVYAAEKNETDSFNKANKNEMIGFGSGAIAGAAVGGPVGAFVGGIFGLFIAEDVNSNAEIKAKDMQLATLKYDLQEQEQSLAALHADYKNLQQTQLRQLVSFEQQTNDAWLDDFTNFESNLQFKTASFLVEDNYKNQLNSLANLLTSYPQLQVKLTGYADQRGDSSYNQTLSTQRAQAVKEYLLSKHVDLAQISMTGAGEVQAQLSTFTSPQLGETNEQTMPTQLNIEDLFFERRVNIQLVNTNKQLTAAN